MTSKAHAYEVRPRKDHGGVNLIPDVLPFGTEWYGEPDAIANAIGYAKFYSRSHDAVIRVYDDAGNMIETTSKPAISKSGRIIFFSSQASIMGNFAITHATILLDSETGHRCEQPN